MRRITTRLAVLLPAALLALTAVQTGTAGAAAPRAAAADAAYFNLHDSSGSDFVVELTDPGRIEEARGIVAAHSNKIVIGTIVKTPAAYNAPWSYHYDPATVSFADTATEVCDASIPYVEEHLDEAGGAFLPDLTWCPWSGRLTAEVTP